MAIIFDRNYRTALAFANGSPLNLPTSEDVERYLAQHKPCYEAPKLFLDTLREPSNDIFPDLQSNTKARRGRPSTDWEPILAGFNDFIQIHGNAHGSLKNYCRFTGISERSFRHARKMRGL